MKKSNAAKSEHESIQLLLPWYLNKTLSEIESVRVRQHINSCEICQVDTNLVQTMLDVSVPSQVVTDTSDERLSRVINRIDAHEASMKTKSKPEASFLHGLFIQTKRLLQPTRLIPVASLAVLASVLVMQFMFKPTEKIYEVRSTTSAEHKQLELRVELSDSLGQTEVQELLLDAGIQYNWRTHSNTTILISLPAEISASDMLSTMGQLEKQEAVKSVETESPY